MRLVLTALDEAGLFSIVSDGRVVMINFNAKRSITFNVHCVSISKKNSKK